MIPAPSGVGGYLKPFSIQTKSPIARRIGASSINDVR
jgi:hypothetical protein